MQRSSPLQKEIPETTDVILTRILFTFLHNMIKLLPISGRNLKRTWTNYLTFPMEPSRSWEAASCAATQENPNTL
jgi:hypothetical protein